jgi:hypothetical protein
LARVRSAHAVEALDACIIHGRFNEGFNTRDLREAKALLAQLR